MEELRALVTGGAGFLGSHIVDTLMASKCHVIVIDNFSSGSIKNVRRWLDDPRFSLLKADLKERDGRWNEMMAGADVIFHFAANPAVRISATAPETHFDENVLATFNMLEAARKEDIEFVVFASTSAVYGDGGDKPVGEECPKRPISVYGASKLACEILIETYHRLYGLKALMLRYANVIGPRVKHSVVVDFISKLKRNPHELEILGDGTQERSFIYVSDAVSATLHLFNLMLNGAFSCEAFNIGNEDWISIRDVADIVVEAMGLSGVRYRFKPMTIDGRGWPGDVKRIKLDIGKLKKTGWAPDMGSWEAVRRTVEVLLKEG